MKVVNGRNFKGSLFTLEHKDGVITGISGQDDLVPPQPGEVDAAGLWVLPGLVDIHVHSRDPGFTHKEDWQSLTRAAYRGGVTCVCDMPNTMPNTMDRASILAKQAVAEAGGIDFFFYLGVGSGNIEQLAALLADDQLPLCGLKVYYGQSTGELMYDDLKRLGQVLPKPFPGLLSFHSEDQCSIDRNTAAMAPGPCQDGKSFQIHSAIRSSAAAHKSTQAILDWAFLEGFEVHIAHLSTPAEVELIEAARGRGQHVSCEVAPHHLIFSTNDYEKWGSWIKMNPPVRTPAERDQLLAYFGKGLIDAFATDHAPHTKSEKAVQEYLKCPSGVPGVEWFGPLLLSLARDQGMSMEQAVAMGSTKPFGLIGQKKRGRLEVGAAADFVLMEEGAFEIPADGVISKCGWTPYEGTKVNYKVRQTFHGGRLVYEAP